MAAKVFESIGKFGLALAVAGGVVNSALYNGEALRGGGSLPVAGGCLLVCTAHVTLLMVAAVCECVCAREGSPAAIPHHVVALSLDLCPCSHRFAQSLYSQSASEPSCRWMFPAALANLK